MILSVSSKESQRRNMPENIAVSNQRWKLCRCGRSVTVWLLGKRGLLCPRNSALRDNRSKMWLLASEVTTAGQPPQSGPSELRNAAVLIRLLVGHPISFQDGKAEKCRV